MRPLAAGGPSIAEPSHTRAVRAMNIEAEDPRTGADTHPIGLALCALLTLIPVGCKDDAPAQDEADPSTRGAATMGPDASTTPPTDDAARAAPNSTVVWECPDGYDVQPGLNVDFPHKGLMRAFVVNVPDDTSTPMPVFVPLTGSVESTQANLTAPNSGATASYTAQSFVVLGPVRACANQDPMLAGGVCNGPGMNGWNWNPWFEGRAPGPSGDAWKNDEGPDSSFFEAMIKCVGTKYPLDPQRFYLGGVSSGGTMTHRALAFRSDFWAGGMPISGEWYVTAADGSPLGFEDARSALAAAPAEIFQGRIGPLPLKSSLDPMIVISVWGGERDLWNCAPDAQHTERWLCADYRPSTQAASNYFSSMPNVVHVACSGMYGHNWLGGAVGAPFNAWALTTLASHPKGSDAETFELTEVPAGFTCQVGRYTDHYPE